MVHGDDYVGHANDFREGLSDVQPRGSGIGNVQPPAGAVDVNEQGIGPEVHFEQPGLIEDLE